MSAGLLRRWFRSVVDYSWIVVLGFPVIFRAWGRIGVIPLVVFVSSRGVVLLGRVVLPDGLYKLGFVEPAYAAFERPDPGT